MEVKDTQEIASPDSAEPTAAVTTISVNFFPYDGRDPRDCYGVSALQCQRCKIVFGDLGTGVCPSCNHHFVKAI